MSATAIDAWLGAARVQAAMRGIELHVLPDDKFELRRGAFVEHPVGLQELAATLRVLGIQIVDPPCPPQRRRPTPITKSALSNNIKA